MSSSNVNLQDSFLNQARRESTKLQVSLLDGTTFEGVVRGFDNFTVVINVDGKQHLVYKHSIAQLIGDLPSRSTRSASKSPRGEKQPSSKDRASKSDTEDEKFNGLDLSKVGIDLNKQKETSSK